MGQILTNIGKFFNSFIIISAIVIIASVIFLYAFPFNVAQVNKITIENEVKAGGTIQYNVDYCRYVGKGVPTETKRYLVPKDKPFANSIELSSSPNTETIDGTTGCRSTPEPIELPVEVSTPVGEYQLMLQIRYCIFPGRCIPVEGRSDFFTVEKPSIPNQLSVIQEQLEQVQNYLEANPAEASAISNAQTNRTVLPPVEQPTVNRPTPQSVAPPATPTPPAQPVDDNPGIIRSTLDFTLNRTTNTVENITKMLGL